ncbi:flagellar basal body P-ring formation chaperone FlgA [Vibrio sp. WXL210]|uniref:flagellar basal body P-ring formation chaperone FlgA n=1 Tax=Vibrio sp. WXL210 TaxID=3450709 RepID=UPI003EC6CC6F
MNFKLVLMAVGLMLSQNLPLALAQTKVDTTENAAIARAINSDIQQALTEADQTYGWRLSEPKIEISLPPGSHRLACGAPLVLERRDKRLHPAGRLRYRVTCPEPGSWSIQAQAQADALVNVTYAQRTIAKDALVQRDDLELRREPLASHNRDFVARPEQMVGLRAQRQIRQGQVITRARISEPFVIARGEQVVIHAGSDRFSASMAGTALENGYLDQQIRVRNSSSGRVIQAVVMESGKVRSLF